MTRLRIQRPNPWLAAAVLAVGAVVAVGAEDAQRLRLPPLGSAAVTALSWTDQLPPGLAWEKMAAGEALTLGTGADRVTVERRRVKGEPDAVLALLPPLTPADAATVKRVAWNGVSGWLIDLTLDAKAHPDVRDRRHRYLAVPMADVQVVLSFAGTPEAFTAQRQPIQEVLNSLHFVAAGLAVDYFAGMNFEQRVLSRVDSEVDFDWGEGSPAPEVPVDEFSGRWTGQLIPPQSGAYTFYTVSDDGVRLWLNDKLIIDNWTDHPPTENEGRFDLEAGKPVGVRLEWYEDRGGAVVRLLWAAEKLPKAVVPRTALRCQPGPGLAVQRLTGLNDQPPATIPPLLGGIRPGSYATELPTGLKWGGAFPFQRLQVGQGADAVQVELRFELLPLADVPQLLPATVATDTAAIRAVQWKDAPAWKVECLLDQKAHPDAALPAQRYIVCPLKRGIFVLAFKAASLAALDKQQDALAAISAGIRFAEKPVDDDAL